MKRNNPEPEHEEEVRQQLTHSDVTHGVEETLENTPENADAIRASIIQALSGIMDELKAAPSGTEVATIFIVKVGDHVTAGVAGPICDLAHMLHQEMCDKEQIAAIVKQALVQHMACKSYREGNIEGVIAASMMHQLFFGSDPEHDDGEEPSESVEE